MILRLQFPYLLRSYKDAPAVLVNRLTGKSEELDEDFFEFVKFCCDGVTDMPKAFLESIRPNYEGALEKGILEELDAPAEIEHDQAWRRYENRYIEHVLWAVTGRCNMHCRHCYLKAGSRKLDEMPIQKAMQLVSEMASCGIHRISLTGGEALTRRGFWPLVDEILQSGICIDMLYSNGALVNDRMLEEYEKRDWHPMISMSFDGLGHHGWLRGVDIAEKLALDALARCQERGIKTAVEYCLHRNNLDTFEATIERLEALGVTDIQVNPLETIGEGHGIGDVAMSPEEYFDFALAYLPKYFKNKTNVPLSFRHYIKIDRQRHVTLADAGVGDFLSRPEYRLCGHAAHKLYVGVDGGLMPCLAFDQESVFRESFPIWDGTKHLSACLDDPAFERIFALSYDQLMCKNLKCGVCAYQDLCAGGCRGKSATKDDTYAIDPWQCTFFKGYFEYFHDMIEDF